MTPSVDLRSMDLPFTHKPGRRERHLRRRHENPLFAWPPEEVTPEALLAAQREDHDEMLAFAESFAAAVQRAVDLPANAGSDEVLALKQDLERLFEQSFGLPEEHGDEQRALRKLLDLISRAVRRAAGSDPLARQELDDEEQARHVHFRLLRQPLVADLLHPQSPIGAQELAPAALSAADSELEALMEVLDQDQLSLLAEQGHDLLDRLSRHGVRAPEANARLRRILQGLAGDAGSG